MVYSVLSVVSSTSVVILLDVSTSMLLSMLPSNFVETCFYPEFGTEKIIGMSIPREVSMLLGVL